MQAVAVALRALLESALGPDGKLASDRESLDAYRRAVAVSEESAPVPTAVRLLCRNLRLSELEREVLLLCVAVELDPHLASLCAVVEGRPTLAFALNLFAQGSWTAVSPGGPLFRYRIVTPAAPGDSWLRAPLRVDDPILACVLGGVPYDERVWDVAQRVLPPPALPPSHEELVSRIVALLEDADSPRAIQISGEDVGAARAIAAAACARLNLELVAVHGTDVPAPPSERAALARVLDRQAILGGVFLLLDLDDHTQEESRAALALAEIVSAQIFVISREPVTLRRAAARIEVQRLKALEQVGVWRGALPAHAICSDAMLEHVAAQFPAGWQTVQSVSAVLRGIPVREGELADAGGTLWETCRAASRRRLDGLAARISSIAGWDDLIVPPSTIATLREIVAQLRFRAQVYESWGMGARSSNRGLGVSALFYGESGTGKTLAAEVIANGLSLDLYRVDLSRVVSKYIGETEKNLRRVFDAAEESGAVLLFDEADALFGRRSEVRDSHDRYANVEVSYLLSRMETYRGLAILTTNFRQALDPAFLRRIRFVVSFPIPDSAHRAAIWRRIFPAETPTRDLDPEKLARLSVTGGTIRNIALGAAFLAAGDGEPVTPAHVLRAATTEYRKLERTLSEAESRGLS